MLTRKINAVISLLTTFFLLYHAIFHAVWMLSNGGIVKTVIIPSWILFGLMIAHAFISIDLAISATPEWKNINAKVIPK